MFEWYKSQQSLGTKKHHLNSPGRTSKSQFDYLIYHAVDLQFFVLLHSSSFCMRWSFRSPGDTKGRNQAVSLPRWPNISSPLISRGRNTIQELGGSSVATDFLKLVNQKDMVRERERERVREKSTQKYRKKKWLSESHWVSHPFFIPFLFLVWGSPEGSLWRKSCGVGPG